MSHHGTITRHITTIRILTKIIRKKNRRIAELQSEIRQQAEALALQSAEITSMVMRIETDPLTGALNRSGLRTAWAERTDLTAVMIVDGDNFKVINDRYGHTAGDEIICLIANTMRCPGITVARIGGDEFVGLISSDDPTAVAESFLRRLSAPRIIQGDTVHITATVGLAHVKIDDQGRPTSTMSECMDMVDSALYRGKRAGGNCVVVA